LFSSSLVLAKRNLCDLPIWAIVAILALFITNDNINFGKKEN
jgi:hypothetical protein